MPRRSQRRYRIDWMHTHIAKPAFLGERVLRDIPLGDLVRYIDWSPFFMAWNVRGEKFSKYPAIFDDPRAGKEARDLFDRANALLKCVINEHTLVARGVYGFFPANSDGDDIVVYMRRIARRTSDADSRCCGSSGSAKGRRSS